MQQASHTDHDLRTAFQSGDRDGDNTLSVREAVTAVQALSGRTLDAEQLQQACNECGVDTGREMECMSPFTTLEGSVLMFDR